MSKSHTASLNPELPKVFVSYSGRDPAEKIVIRQFLSRLHDQPLDVWIYESPEGKVPAGLDIKSYCEKKIDEADLFIAFITEKSLESEWTIREVDYAIDNCRVLGIRIDPIAPPRADWPDAYRVIEKTKLECLKKPEDPSEWSRIESRIEGLIESVCAALDADFSDALVHERAPLAQRICEEIAMVRFDSELDVSIYRDLRLNAFQCVKAYKEHNNSLAIKFARRISFLLEENLDFADHAVGHVPCRNYYPRVLETFVLMESNRPGDIAAANDCLESLEQDFLSSDGITPLYGIVDEHLPALRAMSAFSRGDYVQARCYFQVAWDRFEKIHESDPSFDPAVDANCDLAAGLIQCDLILSFPPDHSVIHRLESAQPSGELDDLSAAELRQKLCLIALSFHCLNPSPEWLPCLRLCERRGVEGWGLSLLVAVDTLMQGVAEFRNPIYHEVVTAGSELLEIDQVSVDALSFWAACGKAADMIEMLEEADRFYQTIIRRRCEHRGRSPFSALAAAAQFYFVWGKQAKLQEVLDLLHRETEFESEGSRMEERLYYRGLMHFYSDNVTEARRDYELSRTQELWYSDALGGDSNRICRLLSRFRYRRQLARF